MENNEKIQIDSFLNTIGLTPIKFGKAQEIMQNFNQSIDEMGEPDWACEPSDYD